MADKNNNENLDKKEELENNKNVDSSNNEHNDSFDKKKKKSYIKSLEEQNDDLIKQLEEMEQRAKNAEAECIKAKDDYVRTLAESQNYKKRLDSERDVENKYRYFSILEKFIEPIELLEKVVNFPVSDPALQNYLYGFKMITTKFADILKDEKVVKIKTVGEKFNPKTEHALETRYEEDKEEDVVLEEKQAGYMYKDRLLKAAYVVVNKKPVEENKTENNSEQKDDNK